MSGSHLTLYPKMDSKCTKNLSVRATMDILDTLSLIVHTHNCNTREVEAEEFLVQSQPGLLSEIMAQKKQVRTNETKTLRRKHRFWTSDSAVDS